MPLGRAPDGRSGRAGGRAVSGTVAVTLFGILLVAILLVLGIVLRALSKASGRAPVTGPGRQRPAAEASDQAEQPGVAIEEADQIRARAQSEAAGILSKAEATAEQAERTRRAAEEEIRAIKDEMVGLRADLERREARLAEREQRLDEEVRKLEHRSASLDKLRTDLDHERSDLDRLGEQRREVLERTAGLTAEQARAELIAGIEGQAKREAALTVRDIESNARKDGDKRARKIVTLAIQRIASEQTSESVVSVLHLPGDEMKGRIIGREGRNIRAFESVTGVNLIIDDTPEAVLLSCFDP